MGSVILLAFGSAVFPTLLGCVAIMISRSQPRRLLLAFYAGGLVTSVTTGILVLALFKDGDDLAGNTKSAPNPWVSIAAGFAALLFSWLMSSCRGRAILDGWRRKHGGAHRKPKREKGPSWAERRLSRASWKLALVVGAVVNLPGPLYLVALGEIARGGYNALQEFGLIILFNAIMFLLLEVPLVGYLIKPAQTAKRVTAMSHWLNANGLRVTGWLIGAVGVGLLAQGIAALAH